MIHAATLRVSYAVSFLMNAS